MYLFSLNLHRESSMADMLDEKKYEARVPSQVSNPIDWQILLFYSEIDV